MTSKDIEIAIWKHWARKQSKIMVPNVSWGLLQYEADIIIVEADNSLTEIEIKVSKSDLIADKSKWHQHNSKKISKLYFAVPTKLQETAIQHCPQKAGIIVVTEYPKINSTLLKIIRKPEKRPPIPQPPDVIRKLFYLMQFRYWKHHDKIRAPKKSKPNSQQLTLI